MRHHPQNGWFHSSEFMRAAAVIHKAATTEHTRWLGEPACKYIQLYTDQRTGDFILRDMRGVMLTHEQVYAMFPELKDDVPILTDVVAAGWTEP